MTATRSNLLCARAEISTYHAVMAPDSSDPALGATQAPLTTSATDAVVPPRPRPSTVPSQPNTTAGSSARLSIANYEVGPLLGHGGMGDVLLCRDQTIGRDVAIKQMRGHKPSKDAVARFLREAKIQARLEHPSIVPVHSLGRDEAELPYFTMKRLTGTTLGELLVAPSPPSQQRVLRMFADVCLAVEFAHSRAVVHRDLKPANIMVGDFGEVYVLDWGLARIVTESEDGGSMGDGVMSLDGHTQAGALLGTPGYMAPEQIEGAAHVGPCADIYALGAILFEILSGEALHPKGVGALTSTLQGIDGGPARRRPERPIAPELDRLCIEALSTRATERPSAKALAERLQRYLDGDRDLEQRRELAKTFVARAEEAVRSGDIKRRAEAIQAAGRALSLDPESTAAAAIVQTLMFEPTRTYPAELVEELGAAEVEVQQRQGKAAMLSFVVILAYLAIACVNGVSNPPLVIGIAAYTVLLATYVWRVTQRPAQRWQMLVIATANCTLAALLSRTYGSMIIVPAVTCIMAVSLTAYPLLIDRRGIVISLLAASWLIPVVLELTGVLAGTFGLRDHIVELTSHVMSIEGTHTMAILIGSNLVTIIVIGLFASALATSRRNAQRQAAITAWHFKQLLPQRQ
ncbi:MAG: serine/threonine protein kinase [Myxococcales bacterium]|nr:serine/threonine protein kinase [Myxococcales bacterium]